MIDLIVLIRINKKDYGIEKYIRKFRDFLIKLDFSGKLCENSFYIVPLYFILQIDISKVRIVNIFLTKIWKISVMLNPFFKYAGI